jgi:hypothetical protein
MAPFLWLKIQRLLCSKTGKPEEAEKCRSVQLPPPNETPAEVVTP